MHPLPPPPGPDAAPRRGPSRTRRRLLLLGLLAVVAGTFGWWQEWGRHWFIPKKWGVVEEGRLYRSGLLHRRVVEETLREHRIATVVDLSGHGPTDPDVAAEREAAARLGIRVVDLPGLEGDGVGDEEAYVAALVEMARATRDRPVLVHCAGGTERTGASVAMYRMLFEQWDGRRAWDEYVDARNGEPKTDRLVAYLREHLPSIARRLEEMGVLPHVPAPLPVFGPEPAR